MHPAAIKEALVQTAIKKEFTLKGELKRQALQPISVPNNGQPTFVLANESEDEESRKGWIPLDQGSSRNSVQLRRSCASPPRSLRNYR